ncbi:MAG TPA: hypothetical protein DD407_14045 [Pseudohongiella sp.]|nr:hypothetical protein [Gammaproteobacteria bacterium]HBN16156.1 hypothetical protein [Pseudohongiella sp.]|tara:strand:+ start:926 stop:1831 length:906 start_codon:yes stop_codon:yes gene_type:complete
MHHYAFNVGDYRKDTGHLTLLEHGIYRMLIDSYYVNEGPLDADDTKLMRTHCIRTPDEQQAYRNVIDDFFELDDGVYRHAGCDKVLAKIFEKSAKARESAERRWAKKSKASKPSRKPDDANAMRTHSEGNADGMLPNTHNPIPIKDNSNELSTSEKKISDPHPGDIKLAEFIYAGVLDATPKAKKPDLHKWADTIRLMRERDKLELREIAEVFSWANKHQFWRLNILSPEKLREKYPRLSAEKENDHANSSRSGNADTRSVTEQSTVGRAHAASERRRQDILEKYSHGAGTGHGGPMGPHG